MSIPSKRSNTFLTLPAIPSLPFSQMRHLNNELSAQYSVRGGNYDENLVYVNDFEIYQPPAGKKRATGRLAFPQL